MTGMRHLTLRQMLPTQGGPARTNPVIGYTLLYEGHTEPARTRRPKWPKLSWDRPTAWGCKMQPCASAASC